MKFLTNLTLGKKITLLTTIGLLLGVGVFSSLGLRAVNQATEAMLQERMTTAQLVAGYLDEELRHALSELQRTAKILEADGAQKDFKAQIDALEVAFSRLAFYTQGIFLIGQNGEIIWSKGISREEGIKIGSLPIIEQTVRNGSAGISGLSMAPLTDMPVVFLASPVNLGLQENAVLVVAVDPAQSRIGGFVQPITLGETGYVEIVDQDGVVVTRTEPGPELTPFEKSDHSGRFAALISVGKPTRGVCHTCHEPEQRVARKDVLAFAPLSEASWGVVIRQSEEEALAPANRLRLNLLLFGVGLVAVAVMFVTVTTRDVGSRIRVLTSVSRRIAGGDLVTPISPLGKDEVGTLGKTLDEMRVKLMLSYDELQRKTKELSSLLSVSELLSSVADLSLLLDTVVAKAVEVISGADSGALFWRNTDNGALLLQCAVGPNKEAISQLVSYLDNDLSSDTERKRRAITKRVITDSTRILPPNINSFISGDVIQRNRKIGKLVIVGLNNKTFSDSDQRVLQAIADGIGMAIERAQLAKEAEEVRALHEADKLRSQIISSVSHELRTPLTLIKGYSTSLLRQDTTWDKETQREFLQIIDEKTDELRDQIDKLLQSAKLEAGVLKLEKEPVLIPRLAEKVVDEFKPRDRKHRFDLQFVSPFPVVEADMRCIEQVLRNLVENAVKYSPDGGMIKISGKMEKKKVVISVSDSGMGIPPEHQGKIFERFYRVQGPSTRGITGSGLGLSIVKGHVEAHGGQVWLESRVGEGSTFSFSLPQNDADESEQIGD